MSRVHSSMKPAHVVFGKWLADNANLVVVVALVANVLQKDAGRVIEWVITCALVPNAPLHGTRIYR